MFRDALSALADMVVPGVSISYDVDATPDHLNRGGLPALLLLPLETPATETRRLFAERGDGFESVAFSDGIRTVNFTVTHLLVVAPVSSGRGLRDHLPALIDLIDAYFGALAARVTLEGHLEEPAQVQVEPGVFAYGGVDYYGCAFRHRWVVQI